MNAALLLLRQQLLDVAPRWLVSAVLGPPSSQPWLSFVFYWICLGLLFRTYVDPWFARAQVNAGVTQGILLGVGLLFVGLGGFPRHRK